MSFLSTPGRFLFTEASFRYGFLNGAADGEEVAPKPTPIDVLRRRETKWLEMLSDWDEYMLKHYKKVRNEIGIM